MSSSVDGKPLGIARLSISPTDITVSQDNSGQGKVSKKKAESKLETIDEQPEADSDGTSESSSDKEVCEDDQNKNENTQQEITEDKKAFQVSGHHLATTTKTTTGVQALVHLIKGNLGTGILAMPDALRHSGLLVGCAVLPFLALVCVYCMHLLVWTCIHLQDSDPSSPRLDYARLGEAAFARGPQKLRFIATFARIIINTTLTVTQLGFCCVYVVFMAANLKQVVDVVYPGSRWTVHEYMLAIILPLLMISMIKTLRTLYYPSLASNVLILVGLVLLLTSLLQDLPNPSNRPLHKPVTGIPLFISTSIYAFEGIGVVLPLHHSMVHKEELGGLNGVLNTATILVTCLYIGMGFYGYLKYGDLVEGSITLNLPRTEPLAIAINLIFVVAIFLTYALMLYVPVDLLWPSLSERFSKFPRKSFTIHFFRGVLVLMTVIFAALIPHIGLFISLVGAIASTALTLIFPPILHLLAFYETQSWLGMVRDLLIATFGVFCFVTGSYTSIRDIVLAFDVTNS